MKRLLVLAIVVAGLALAGCVPLKGAAPPTCTPSPNFAAEVFDAVNADRSDPSFGFAPVAWDQQLANQAQAWVENMAARGVVYHSSHGTERENVLGHWPCITNGADLEATWFGSPGHQWTMMNPTHTRMGVGWVVTGSELWAVQQFG